MEFKLVAHCDWSVNARKRWMSVADRVDGTWVVSSPEVVQESSMLITRLQIRAGLGEHVLIGFDFPIGLPEWYATQTGFQSFRHALANLGNDDWRNWFDVATHHSEISLHRPFYPRRPGGTRRDLQLTALGASNQKVLLRQCELANGDRRAACSLFWTLGGNQVGKGAISGWREVIIPNLNVIGLWPFDGRLSELSNRCPIVIAETYPGDVHAQLGIGRGGWSKRRQPDRQRMGARISTWLDARPSIDAAAIQVQLADGFGSDRAGEDRFDAVVGLLGMLMVVDGERDEGAPHTRPVTTYEGWMLGHHR